MGTRLNPGAYDCHEAALDDEPRFALLARDPLAGFLVSIWSSMRFGDLEAVDAKCDTMMRRLGPDYEISPDVAAGSEAIECAMAMFAWRTANLGRWREPQDRTPSDVVKALGAAVMALRSYQHGNAAPDLAASIADAGEEALRVVGFAPGFMATEPQP